MVSGNMKEYLNYLVKNPSKLLFALGGSLFTLFLIVILFAVNYQVYTEWKDGRNR